MKILFNMKGRICGGSRKQTAGKKKEEKESSKAISVGLNSRKNKNKNKRKTKSKSKERERYNKSLFLLWVARTSRVRTDLGLVLYQVFAFILTCFFFWYWMRESLCSVFCFLIVICVKRLLYLLIALMLLARWMIGLYGEGWAGMNVYFVC